MRKIFIVLLSLAIAVFAGYAISANNSNKRIKDLENQNSQLTIELEEERNNNSNSEELEDAQALIVTLQSSLLENQYKLDKANSDLNTLETSHAEITEQLESLENSNNLLQDEKDLLQNEISLLEQQIATINSERVTLEQQNAELTALVTELRTQIIVLESEIASLRGNEIYSVNLMSPHEEMLPWTTKDVNYGEVVEITMNIGNYVVMDIAYNLPEEKMGQSIEYTLEDGILTFSFKVTDNTDIAIMLDVPQA